MISRKVAGVTIKAISTALPVEVADSKFFAGIFGQKEVDRVIRGTGISSVRCATGLQTSDLIAAAANQLLNQEPFDRSEIDGLIVVTQTADTWSPGPSFSMHHNLGLGTHCLCLDINSGCAGYVNGLIQAASLVASGSCSNVLLCTGDINTRLVDDTEHQVRMLFGDAASATLVSRGDDGLRFIYGADGGGRDHLGVRLAYEKGNGAAGSMGYMKMDGAAVMSFAMRRVPEVLNSLLAELEISKEDVDLFALHQPNEFVLNYIRKIFGINQINLPSDVDGIGNTNSSSIPLVLSRRAWGNSGLQNIVLCGFGVGLAWNAAHLDLSRTVILPPVELAAAR